MAPDIFWTMEQQGMVKYSRGQSYLCLDGAFLNELYKRAGQPGKVLKREMIRWVPFK